MPCNVPHTGKITESLYVNRSFTRNLHRRWGFPSYHGTSSLRFSWTATLDHAALKIAAFGPCRWMPVTWTFRTSVSMSFLTRLPGPKNHFLQSFFQYDLGGISSFHQLVGSSFTRTTWRKDTRYPQFHGRTCVYLSYIMCLMMFFVCFRWVTACAGHVRHFGVLLATQFLCTGGWLNNSAASWWLSIYLSIYSNPVE